jgi:hypothetical protein
MAVTVMMVMLRVAGMMVMGVAVMVVGEVVVNKR